MELLIAILAVGVLTGATLGVLMSVGAVFHSQSARMLNQDDARLAINQVARYLRMATSSADNQTSQDNAIATARPQELEFYCDVDGDEVAEKVRYYLASATLRMQTAEPVWNTTPQPHWEYPSYTTDGIIIQNAVLNGSDPVFRYYKNSGGALVEFSPSSESARREVVTVGISLRVNEQPHVAKGNVQLATVVELRQRYTGGLQ